MFDLGYNFSVVLRGIPEAERRDAAIARQQPLPARAQIRPERRAHAHSGDDHSVHYACRVRLLLLLWHGRHSLNHLAGGAQLLVLFLRDFRGVA